MPNPTVAKNKKAGAGSAGGGDGGATTSPNPKLAARVTIASLALFAIAVVFLAIRADDASDTTWIRWTVLLSGVEAITFAAVGWLFGREVNRQRADTAEKKEAEAQQTASDAKERATKAETTGTALKHAIGLAQAAVGTPTNSETDELGPSDTKSTSVPTHLDHLAAIAQVFPD